MNDTYDDDYDGFNISGQDIEYMGGIDYQSEVFPNTIWYTKGPHELIIFLATFLPVVSIGLTGNILVIYVLATDRHCRNPTNLLIGNMAVADMFSLVLHPWVIFVYNYFQNYQLGPVGCKGEGALECTILIASVISMSAITYDRLTAIVLPNETRINKSRAKVIMALTWLIGLTLSIPLIIYRTYKERIWLNFDEKYCNEHIIVTNMYWFVIITVLVLIPLTIQIICYTSIFIKLNKYEKIIAKSFQFHQLGYKRSAAKMIFIVIVTFMVCRIPYMAYIFYRHRQVKGSSSGTISDVKNQANGLYHTLWYASKYLLIANAAVNPLIYGVTNLAFRNAFRRTRLFKCLLSERAKTFQKKQKSARIHNGVKTGNIFHILRKRRNPDASKIVAHPQSYQTKL
ncbi:substance-K receptor-like [Cylas formicarius]|uniref:substance-K receptor-like n=1 Tax=Cylas formicarius TaxID=197179 RepID=UPI00295848E2|nr:substance-K receptor-like [Cylas formicarius]XP_060521575.1 substance-K receptor-like [Cylas formicarius]